MAGGPKLWEGVSGGRLAEAQKFADQGQWGQAAQQYKLGGGQFGQPQMQAFSQQYNVPIPSLGSTFFRPSEEQYGAQQIHNTIGGSDMGPQSGYEPYFPFPGQGSDKPQPIGEYVSDDIWGPPAQAQPIAPPVAKPMPPQAQPAPPPSFVPRPPPQMSAPQNPNWASYVQGNPDLLAAYNQGSPQSIGDWGKSHWESFGQNEGRSVNPYSGLLA